VAPDGFLDESLLAAAKLACCRVKERLHGRGVHITERHGQ
jgi:hypothetical protein